jgi:hypothetical protein
MEEFDLHWQMTRCEQFALVGLLQKIAPAQSIEVGTYLGGSLQVLAKYSEHVISVDIDPSVGQRLDGRFSNVAFRSGNSTEILPALIDELNQAEKHVDFVLIDGDHSERGVKRDIESILGLIPRRKTTIILHDSFNPDCRAGMRAADWNRCPFVHSVELDFIPGIYHAKSYDKAEARTMWGGFACAILDPMHRKEALEVSESQRELFEAVYSVSAHAPAPQRPLHRRIVGRIARTLGLSSQKRN